MGTVFIAQTCWVNAKLPLAGGQREFPHSLDPKRTSGLVE